MSTASSNRIFFETGKITVTASRFESGTDSFPIRKISGVKIATEKRDTRTGIALVAAGVAALLGGAFTNFPLLLVAGAAFTVGGAMMCFARVSHTIVLTTRGNDVRALTSTDGALVRAVVAALQDAIGQRD